MAETSVNDTIKRLSKTQTEVAIDPTEEGRSLVGDLARDPIVDLVRGHNGQSTGGAQLRPHQNRDLSGGTQLLLQRNIDAMEVDPLEVPDSHVVEVVADQTIANRADDLSNFISDSEIRACIAVLKKQKKRTELKTELERLEHKKTGGFVGKHN